MALHEHITLREKLEAINVLSSPYDYEAPTPPVYTGNWSDLDWVNYIDQNGKWVKKI